MTRVSKGSMRDANALGKMMYHAIRHGAVAYTVPQRAAWAPAPPKGRNWHLRLSRMDVRIVRGLRGPMGFVAMTPAGYVDFAYVAPQAQGRGYFRALIEDLIRDYPDLPMTTHASLHARPAFAALGFRVVYPETVLRQGQRLRRTFMARP